MRHQPLSRARAITLLVALATLTSNTLSSLLFAQLPDDPYHLARTFGWYLHFANVGSVFGFIGALRVSFFFFFYLKTRGHGRDEKEKKWRDNERGRD